MARRPSITIAPPPTWQSNALLGIFAGNWLPPDPPLVFVLSSIVWREAWKYKDRSYRYCLHDIGHAWQALALAARAMGCESFAVGQFEDDKIAEICLLNKDEWPMLIVQLVGSSIPQDLLGPGERRFAGRSAQPAFGGANRLSID